MKHIKINFLKFKLWYLKTKKKEREKKILNRKRPFLLPLFRVFLVSLSCSLSFLRLHKRAACERKKFYLLWFSTTWCQSILKIQRIVVLQFYRARAALVALWPIISTAKLGKPECRSVEPGFTHILQGKTTRHTSWLIKSCQNWLWRLEGRILLSMIS